MDAKPERISEETVDGGGAVGLARKGREMGADGADAFSSRAGYLALRNSIFRSAATSTSAGDDTFASET
jgi:hypothetical protein